MSGTTGTNTTTVTPKDTPSGGGVEGASISSSAPEVSRTNTIADLVSEIGWHKARAKLLAEDSTRLHEEFLELHDEGLAQLLRVRTVELSKSGVQDLLSRLAQLGFAWSDIARMLGISVPALRKWRNGESPSGDNRRKLAELSAVCEVIEERNPLLVDVAGWMETPLSPSAPVTGIDLVQSGRHDLVFSYASGEDPEAVLDAYDPSWRESYVTDVEVFAAADGLPAIRVRSGG